MSRHWHLGYHSLAHCRGIIYAFGLLRFIMVSEPKITSVSPYQVCNKLQVRLPPYAHPNPRLSTSQVKIAASPVKCITILQKVCPSVSSSILIPCAEALCLIRLPR